MFTRERHKALALAVENAGLFHCKPTSYRERYADLHPGELITSGVLDRRTENIIHVFRFAPCLFSKILVRPEEQQLRPTERVECGESTSEEPVGEPGGFHRGP